MKISLSLSLSLSLYPWLLGENIKKNADGPPPHPNGDTPFSITTLSIMALSITTSYIEC